MGPLGLALGPLGRHCVLLGPIGPIGPIQRPIQWCWVVYTRICQDPLRKCLLKLSCQASARVMVNANTWIAGQSFGFAHFLELRPSCGKSRARCGCVVSRALHHSGWATSTSARIGCEQKKALECQKLSAVLFCVSKDPSGGVDVFRLLRGRRSPETGVRGMGQSDPHKRKDQGRTVLAVFAGLLMRPVLAHELEPKPRT